MIMRLFRCDSAQGTKFKVHSFNKGAHTEIQGQEVTPVLCLINAHKQLIRYYLEMFKRKRVREGSEGHVMDCKQFQLEITMAHQLGTCTLGLLGRQGALHDIGQVMKLCPKLFSADSKWRKFLKSFCFKYLMIFSIMKCYIKDSCS